eukprot:scaffold294594_cov94-Attheya_sp.AAC.1
MSMSGGNTPHNTTPVANATPVANRSGSFMRRSPVLRSPAVLRSPGVLDSLYAPVSHETMAYNIPRLEDQPDGTKGNPYIIHANLKCMERNGGFEVVGMHDVEHNFKKYDVVEFRVHSTLNDGNKWSAEIWSSGIPHEYQYQNRAIMIIGPSVDEFSKDKDKSASKFVEDEVCPNSLSARNTQLLAIGKDADHKSNYYLLLFPQDFDLDNSVFCHDTTTIKKFKKDMSKPHPSRHREIHTGSFVIWRVALRGGMEVGEEEEDKQLPAYD